MLLLSWTRHHAPPLYRNGERRPLEIQIPRSARVRSPARRASTCGNFARAGCVSEQRRGIVCSQQGVNAPQHRPRYATAARNHTTRKDQLMSAQTAITNLFTNLLNIGTTVGVIVAAFFIMWLRRFIVR